MSDKNKIINHFTFDGTLFYVVFRCEDEHEAAHFDIENAKWCHAMPSLRDAVLEYLTQSTEYDHRNDTRFTFANCEAAVGKKASVTITGTIDEARESCNGPFVMLKVDERWGFGDHRLGLDLDALTVQT